MRKVATVFSIYNRENIMQGSDCQMRELTALLRK